MRKERNVSEKWQHRGLVPLSLLVMAVLVAAVLAGCGSSGSSTGGTESASKGSQTTASGEEASSEAEPSGEEAESGNEEAESLAFQTAALERNVGGVDIEKAFECWKEETCETGHGELTVALADGFGDNVWRQITRMDFVLQALTYPEVKKIIYLNAHGETQQAISNIQSLISQGVNVITTYPDAGAAMLPIIKQAQQAGIQTVVYGAAATGEPGVDYTAWVHPGICKWAEESAEEIIQKYGDEATVMLLSGTTGNLQSPEWQACAKKVFSESNVNIVGPLDTEWTQQGALQATSALLAQESGEVDALMYEYADGARGAVRAFQQAGRPIPRMYFFTEDNGLAGEWVKLHKSQPNFNIIYTNGGNNQPRIALSAGIAAMNGESVPPNLEIPLTLTQLKASAYQSNWPSSAPLESDVPEELLEKMFEAEPESE